MIQILVAGDFCPKERVAELIEKENYESVLGNIKKYTSKADYSIVNLEAPIVNSPAIPIEKCGPHLKCNYKSIKALKWAGFNMVTLANNHFYDYGNKGVEDTLEECKKEEIAIVGGGMTIHEAAQTAYIEVNNVKIGIINCCEHEFSIATETTGGSNPINPIRQFYAIQEAKNKANVVIVIVHGGHEGYQLPSPRMTEVYRFFINAGADAIINHHQHCYSGYEVYNNKPIFYGLGNFSFDRSTKRNNPWNEGYMVALKIDAQNIGFELVPYIQGDKEAGISVLKEVSKFETNIRKLNTIISNETILKQKHVEWMTQTNKGYKLAFEPYQNRFLSALYIRGLLPSFINERKKMRLLNYLECEAHLERTINFLKS